MSHHRCEDFHGPDPPIAVGPLENSYIATHEDAERRLAGGERQVRCPACCLWIWASQFHHFPAARTFEHRGGGHWVETRGEPNASLPVRLTRVGHRLLEFPFGGAGEMSLCEYNPEKHEAAFNPPAPGDCPDEATVIVGAKANWHLCERCAALDEFKRLKKTRLKRTASRSDTP